jgi:hypothetical protein
MSEELKKTRDAAYEKEKGRATRCCENCLNKFINSEIYFDYGFYSAVEAMSKTHVPREQVDRLVDSYKFLLNAAVYVYAPDKPLHRGLDPTFYHTLSYEGDEELINKTNEARKALAAYEQAIKGSE